MVFACEAKDALQEAKGQVQDSDSDWIEEDGYKRRTIKDMSFNQSFQSGPLNISVKKVTVIDILTNDKLKSMYDDKDEITYISMDVRLKNTSDDEFKFYADEAKLSTSTNEEIKASLFMSDSIGPEFKANEEKEGKILFVSESKWDKLNKTTLMIHGPIDRNRKSIGEDLSIDIDL